MSDYLALAADIAALIGPTTDPTTDTENAAIVRLSGNTRTDALARANATVGDGSPPYIGVRASNAAGTLSHAAGSSTITGVGTTFTSAMLAGSSNLIFFDVPAGSDPWGIGFKGMAYVTVVNDTTLTVSSLIGPSLPTFSGVTWQIPDATHLVNADTFSQWIGFTIYYDFPWCLYQSAYKHAGTTDGPALMAKADALAKIWWEHPFRALEARLGHANNNFVTSPRQEALGSLFIWAIRGCPGATDPTGTATHVWDFLRDNVEDHWADWFSSAVMSSSVIGADVRDRGYLLHYTVMLAAVHPDSAVRAACLAKALDVAVNYFARLQFADGTWRAQNSAWFNATDHTGNYLAAQPFLTGLLLNALIDLHRLIGANPTYTTQAATVLASLKLGVAGQMRCYGGTPDHSGYTAVTSFGNAPVRGMTYSYGDANLGFDASTYMPLIPGNPDGNRWNDPKANIEKNVLSGGDFVGDLAGAVSGQRFLNSTTVHAPFYAALYETDPTTRASYLAFGDELLKAQWEYTDGDGYRSQWYTTYPKNKDWDEHMRAQMRGLAWRKMAVAGLTAEDTSGGTPTATHLALSVQPSSSTVSGVAHAVQPSGLVQDATNATVFGDASTVTASWVSETGSGTAIGTLTTVAVAGVWSFAGKGLGVTSAAGCTGHWHFADGSLTGVDSSTITITAPSGPLTYAPSVLD